MDDLLASLQIDLSGFNNKGNINVKEKYLKKSFIVCNRNNNINLLHIENKSETMTYTKVNQEGYKIFIFSLSRLQIQNRERA